MVTRKTLIALALSFPETSEAPHFDKTSFRVRGKIFATPPGLCEAIGSGSGRFLEGCEIKYLSGCQCLGQTGVDLD